MWGHVYVQTSVTYIKSTFLLTNLEKIQVGVEWDSQGPSAIQRCHLVLSFDATKADNV